MYAYHNCVLIYYTYTGTTNTEFGTKMEKQSIQTTHSTRCMEKLMTHMDLEINNRGIEFIQSRQQACY